MAFVQCDIFSYELGMDTELTVLLPEKRQQKPIDRSNQRYKVLYLLHGHGDDHTAYIRKSLIELLVRDKDLVIVMPNCHRGMYTDGIYTHRYYSYVAEELPIVTANLFHGSLEPKDQYIAGFSMGGYGAAKIALRNPGRYAAVGVLSGGMDMEDHMARGTGGHFTVPDMERNQFDIFGSPERFHGSQEDLFALLDQAQSAGGFAPKFYHACGTEDFLYSENVRFRDALRGCGGTWDYTYEEGPGGHDWDFWNTYLPRMLRCFGLIDGHELGWMTGIAGKGLETDSIARGV